MVLSAWISNHELDSVASSELPPAAAAAVCSQNASTGQAEADDQRAARLDELAAGERRAVNVDAVLVDRHHCSPRFAISVEARCTASMIAA